MIMLPQQVTIALNLLNTNGYEAFVVGGCVRDYLLNKSPNDIDITTNALPEKVLEIFDEYRVIETGIKHGTVTVIIKSMPLEITTYRIDGNYSDNRRPDKVSYTQNINKDLARRDFTINAIAYHPNVGVIDPYGGINDIKNQVIKAVGNAEIRFSEDALRILRGVRFASTLGFSIDGKTYKAMNSKKNLLNNISAERIFVEFTKMLLGKNFKQAFEKSVEIWSVIIPEINFTIGFNQNNPYHIYDVFSHTLNVVNCVQSNLILKLAAFFHDIGKPNVYSIDEKGVGHFYGHAQESAKIAENVLCRLKCDNNTKDKVITLINYHDSPIEPNSKNIKKWLKKLSIEQFYNLLKLKKADILSQNLEYKYRIDEIDKIYSLAEEIIANSECYDLKDLKINGLDLIKMGYNGREIGIILNSVLENVIDEKIRNKKTEIIEFINNNF